MRNVTETQANAAPPGKGLNVGLWVVQVLLFITFTGTAVWKLLTPIPKLAGMIPWAGQVPPGFMYATGLIDLCGGLGVLLPALTRVKPKLTELAALGCAALQLCAAMFHFARGEGANTPFNFLLLGLSLFVFWGRRFKAPLVPRA